MTTLQALEEPFAAGQLAAGPAVQQLERKLADRFVGFEAVAVGDMTHALAVALRLCGVGKDDEVLSLAFNCMSSNTAIPMVGARPAWVDVDARTAAFDLNSAQRRLTARTKAVIVYHVSGYPADLAGIRAFCDQHGLPLIEDANNAFGAHFDGRPIGSWGDFAIFSLYANRQINGIDGGILLCRDAENAARARQLRRFGIDVARFRDAQGEIDPAADVTEIGTSSTLNNVNATLALASLADVEIRIEQSRRNAAILSDAVGGTPIIPIVPVEGAEPVYWTWLARMDARDQMMRALKEQGIACSKLHHPNHHYTGFGTGTTILPGTECLASKMLAIPCGWWIDAATATRIGAAIATISKSDR